jgi:HEAT repeat protein
VAQYLSSPRFAIRMEALSAIENMEVLDPTLVRTLMEEVERHPFTTAYVAARILGKRGVVEAIPCLRAAMGAEDYMLQGASVVALARLGDQESRARIESIIISAATPRVKISAALALEILGNRESLPVLVSCLKSHDPPAFVSDEIVLASASLLGIMNEFYPLYKIFSEDEGAGIRTLSSAAEDLDRAPEWKHRYSEALHALFAEGDGNAAPMSILVLTAGIDPADDIVLAEAILDPDLAYRGFRFLVAACPVLIPAPRSPDRSSVSQDRD